MLSRNSILILILIICIWGECPAQERPDSTDVTGVYQKIEVFSTQRKITSLLYGMILRPVRSSSPRTAENTMHRQAESYINLEGKIIRQIHIVTLDPFGFSIYDTLARPLSRLEKGGNSLHVKTQRMTIQNRLLIKKYDTFDSLLVTESERLIRSQNYIHDVSFKTVHVDSDSVDIYIRVSDFWSIIPDGALSKDRISVGLSDKNLAGSGHTFSNIYQQNFKNGRNAFSAYYYVPNFKNSYISARVAYAIDENRYYYKSLNLERPFFSPVARWAGGIYLTQQKLQGWVHTNDTTHLVLASKYNLQDYWSAVAWQIFRGKSQNDRTTKLILSGRLVNIRFLERPAEQPDIADFYKNEQMILSGLGLSSRRYIKQNYIFRTGTPEDVPVGFAYGIVGGYKLKNSEHFYLGLRHSWGNIFKWGYFGSHIEYGTFFSASQSTEGVLSAGIDFFTNLLTIGNWKFRQFARPELTLGLNRTSLTRLTINDGYGLNGFNSDELNGTKRFVFSLQTQSYAPWSWMGFRFGPYLNLSFGMLGNAADGFRHSRLYNQLGMGVLIRNDYLVFRNLQVSFAFYPSIPGKGENIFKANPFRTTDFGFADFILGKPETIDYR